MSSRLTPVDILIAPWFADHNFNGRIVLPAVESMSLLAAEISRNHPEINIRVMEDVRFTKFLEIPVGRSKVTALVEEKRMENGQIRAALLSRVQCKSLTRLKEHGSILFSTDPSGLENAPWKAPGVPAGPVTEIAVEDIYRQLVPFGPAYHTLQDTLSLAGTVARGKLYAPEQPAAEGIRRIIGSPFPLDGAFHAACVLGQCFAEFVPFPTGFTKRLIQKPTQPGGSYFTRVELLLRKQDELVFDLAIFDDRGEIYEIVSGVRMRDVSGGTVKPPDWITRKNEA